MAGLCEGDNEPPGSLKASKKVMNRYSFIRSKSNCKVILDYVMRKREDPGHFKGNKTSKLKPVKESV
ncbi:hypothetical protein ANN_12956 [Periplaneta americana]|uniref:Uncharacterized protein n=1 Tax=Periplaneta americana TaxID=6978 RepID=A0ABQ8TIJ3_PERAM|nr:hypothetical protein ANN_12956 [Periplaneta americana]